MIERSNKKKKKLLITIRSYVHKVKQQCLNHQAEIFTIIINQSDFKQLKI